MDMILFYDVDDYTDNGGGSMYEDFNNIEDVYKRIEELKNDSRITFQRVIIVADEKKIIPVEKVTEWVIK